MSKLESQKIYYTFAHFTNGNSDGSNDWGKRGGWEKEGGMWERGDV